MPKKSVKKRVPKEQKKTARKRKSLSIRYVEDGKIAKDAKENAFVTFSTILERFLTFLHLEEVLQHHSSEA